MRKIKSLLRKGWLVEMRVSSIQGTTTWYQVCANRNTYGEVGVYNTNLQNAIKEVYAQAAALQNVDC